MFKKNFVPYKEPVRSGSTLVSYTVNRGTVKDSGQDVTYCDVEIQDKYPPLPPPENFTIEKLKASGIPIKEVNSVVFRENSVDENAVINAIDAQEQQEQQQEDESLNDD